MLLETELGIFVVLFSVFCTLLIPMPGMEPRAFVCLLNNSSTAELHPLPWYLILFPEM